MTSTSLHIPSFLSSLHECYWYGVAECLNGTHITEISLDSNNLIGKLPKEFGQLPHLQRLFLSRNHLAGRLVTRTFSASLSQLHLGGNSFIGGIPGIDFPHLLDLDLSGNKLTGGLEDLFHSLPKNLTRVNLGRNRLQGIIPDTLAEYTALSKLFTRGTDFSIHPISNSSNLTSSSSCTYTVDYLDLSESSLNGSIPEILCQNEGIYINTYSYSDVCPTPIRCSCCRQNYCPTPPPTPAPTISQPPSISLAPTYDPQEFYDVLANITDMNILEDPNTPQGKAIRWLIHGDGRHLQPDDPTLDQRYIMATIYFSTNGYNWTECFAGATSQQCGGPWDYSPPFLSEESECYWGRWAGNACNSAGKITYVRLLSNNLSGPLPPELAALSQLRSVFLQENSLSGTILDAWPQRLEILDLSMNQLTGDVGGNFPPLLQYLNLGENRLTGTIDEMIDGLKKTTQLNILYLQSNQFVGTIPSALADLSSKYASSFYLQDNNLTGKMPDAVCDTKPRWTRIVSNRCK